MSLAEIRSSESNGHMTPSKKRSLTLLGCFLSLRTFGRAGN